MSGPTQGPPGGGLPCLEAPQSRRLSAPACGVEENKHAPTHPVEQDMETVEAARELATASAVAVISRPVESLAHPAAAATSDAAAGAAAAAAAGAAPADRAPLLPGPLPAPAFTVQPSDFIILRVIGRGAYGKVLQVAHAASGRVYAMKVYSKAMLASQKQLAYTEGERCIMARLHHPYIVALRFAFQTRTRLFLISDYCAGGELFNALRKRGLLQEDAARIYLGQLVLALEHMHAEGVLHRDLKPENVLLDVEGHVAITDFGLSKDLGSGQGASARTHSLVGTDEYLAPEMILNSKWWAVQCAGAAADRREKLAAEERSRAAAAGAGAGAGADCQGAAAAAAAAAEERERDIKAAGEAAASLPGYGRSVDFWALGALAYEMLCGACAGPGSLPSSPPPLFFSPPLHFPLPPTSHPTTRARARAQARRPTATSHARSCTERY